MSGFDDGQLLRALQLAIDGFGARLSAVGEDDWRRATPCTEWDVRALVNHVVGANIRYQMLLHDAALVDVEATRDLDHLGDDPREAFAITAAAMIACFDEPGVLDRTFRHAVGERTGRELLVMRIYDIGVHTWDLATAIGSDDRVDPAVVAIALTITTADDDANDDADDVPAQRRLLLRSGRQPSKEVTR